ncbi:hypothetical protein [Photobacterium damselae]|nr:hypothetical protein [Photobacterium damselae]
MKIEFGDYKIKMPVKEADQTTSNVVIFMVAATICAAVIIKVKS